jgi:hypothetical protein
MTLYTDEGERFAGAHEALQGAVQIGPVGTPIYRLPLVIDRIT